MRSHPEKPHRSTLSTEERDSIANTSLDFIAEEYNGINFTGS